MRKVCHFQGDIQRDPFESHVTSQHGSFVVFVSGEEYVLCSLLRTLLSFKNMSDEEIICQR